MDARQFSLPKALAETVFCAVEYLTEEINVALESLQILDLVRRYRQAAFEKLRKPQPPKS